MQADAWQGRRKGARAEPLPLTRGEAGGEASGRDSAPPGAGCARPSAWELAGGAARGRVETNRLRVGVLGAGPIAQAAHLEAIRKARACELHAICDRAADLL